MNDDLRSVARQASAWAMSIHSIMYCIHFWTNVSDHFLLLLLFLVVFMCGSNSLNWRTYTLRHNRCKQINHRSYVVKIEQNISHRIDNNRLRAWFSFHISSESKINSRNEYVVCALSIRSAMQCYWWFKTFFKSQLKMYFSFIVVFSVILHLNNKRQNKIDDDIERVWVPVIKPNW